MRCRSVRRFAFLSATLSAACALPKASPPPAEFLVATSDSAFWVQAGAEGVRVRGVPMTLAVFDGQYRELYVAGVDRSFNSAIFVGERLYQRNLLTGDSTVVLEDTALVGAAKRYGRTNRFAQPLSPDDPDPEDPDVSAAGETDILSVRGSYVLVERRVTIESENDDTHDTTRVAVDLRNDAVVDDSIPTTALDDSSAATPLPRTWRRNGYDLVALGDSTTGSVSLVLRDNLRRSWPIVNVGTPPRVYWLDQPAVNSATRRALMHAFNEAATYDETVRFASVQTIPYRRPVARYVTAVHKHRLAFPLFRSL